MRPLGELESRIMRVVWQEGKPITIRHIVDELGSSPSLAHTTVITVAERLREKGWLTRHRMGRAYEYAASISAADYSAQLMSEVLDAAQDRPAALLRFAGHLDPLEAAALRGALDDSAGARQQAPTSAESRSAAGRRSKSKDGHTSRRKQ